MVVQGRHEPALCAGGCYWLGRQSEGRQGAACHHYYLCAGYAYHCLFAA